MNSIFSRCVACDGQLSPCDFSAAPGTWHHTLLNSNEGPLESDRVIVMSTISQVDGHLVWISNEIARLCEQRLEPDSKELKQLAEEEASLSSYRAANHAVFSPLRRLPPELLSEIFMWTLTSARRPQNQQHSGFHERDSPWVLTHVCRTWRAVAVSTPSLWSILTLDYASLAPSSSYPLNMVETHIARAPTLRIKFHGFSDRHESNKIEIFQCLVKNASRWEQLHLEPTEGLYPLLDGLRGCVPLLRKARISILPFREPPETQSFEFLNTAPSLADIALANQPPSFLFHPSSQLTRYELRASIKLHRNILKLAPRLIEAHIVVDLNAVDINSEPWADLDSHEITTLASVRRLYVSETETLDYIRAPVLEELSVHLGTRHCPYLHSFLMHSSTTLQCLCIEPSWQPATYEISAVLNNIPSLIELRLIVPLSTQQVNTTLAELTVSGVGTRIVAPRLSCISVALGPWAVDSFEFGAYVEMVKSRLKSTECALTSTELCMASTPNPDSLLTCTRSSLESLHESGLQFILLTDFEAEETTDHWTYISDFYS